jgi:BolA family transcriptional regulator, general stress-responsive regulator
MIVRTSIERKLTAALTPIRLDVCDESHRHAGHMGYDPNRETHFFIEIVSPAFQGKSRLERHRMVNTLLAEELANGVHALSLTAKTPEEAAAA